jgi:hypothetical protein
MRTPRCIKLNDAWSLVGTINKVWCNEFLVGCSFRWFKINNDTRSFLGVIQVLIFRLFRIHRPMTAPIVYEKAYYQQNHKIEMNRFHSHNDSTLYYRLIHNHTNNNNHYIYIYGKLKMEESLEREVPPDPMTSRSRDKIGICFCADRIIAQATDVSP